MGKERVMHTDTKQRTNPVGGDRRPRVTRTVIAVSIAFVVLLAAVVTGLVATQDRGGQDGTQSSTATSVEPSATAPPTTPAGDRAAPAAPTRASPPATPVLADGRHPVYLTGIDVAGRSVEFDLIQFLTGDEADAAYHKDYPDQHHALNNHYIINDNPTLRRLPVADDVAVTVLDWNATFRPLVVAFADLPTELAARGLPRVPLGGNPFWLTVENGTITAIEEQYIP
jgi:hypothetical protein